MACGRTLRELFDNMLALGMLTGTIYHRNGLFVARSLPVDIHQTITPKVIRSQKVTELLGRSWRDIAVERVPKPNGGYTMVYPKKSPDKITTYQRDCWYAYAKGLGSAYNQEKRLLRPKRLGIIHRGGFLMSGWNAFYQANKYAKSCDWKIPRFEPPASIMNAGSPSAPYIERVWLEGSRIWIAIEEPLFDTGWQERAIRVWGAIQHCGLTYYLDVIGVIDVQGINSTEWNSSTPKRYTIFSVDTFQLSKRLFGVGEATITDLDGAKILLQCDAVSAHSEKYGAIVSAVGNLVKFRTPRREKEDGLSKKIKDHIRTYLRGIKNNNYFSKIQARMNSAIYYQCHKDKIIAKRREKYRNDPAFREKCTQVHKKYRERNRDSILARRRERYKKNRDRINAERRKRYREDIEYRTKVIASQTKYQHKKYREDEQFRKKTLERLVEYKRKNRDKVNAKIRQRYKEDAAYRERTLERTRRWRKRKKGF